MTDDEDYSKPPEGVFWLWSGPSSIFVMIRRRRRRRRIFTPPSFSRDELFIFILYFDSPFFCFQQVDFKVERLQTKSSLCLLLCAELTFFIILGWKRICQLKELCLIKLVDNNLASIFNVAFMVAFIFAKTLMFLLFHYFISTKKAKLLPLFNLP